MVLLAVVAPPKRAGERGVMVNPVATRLCCTEVSTTTSAMVKNSFVDMTTMRDVIVRRRVSSQLWSKEVGGYWTLFEQVRGERECVEGYDRDR